MCWGGCERVKSQCSFLIISAELNTNVRVAGDIALLNWIPHSAVQFFEHWELANWNELDENGES